MIDTAWPTGTVTFLFTDIEGSSGLAERLDAAWPAVLETHRRLLRDAWVPLGGVETKRVGDGSVVVFTTAPDAVRAAAAAQRAIAEAAWPTGVELRVRMGLHTGEGQLDGDGEYVGLDLHRAARIASLARGGEVLVSDATRALLGRGGVDGLGVRDLGRHRLRGLREPERIHQLVGPGLLDRPAQLRGEARLGNLPPEVDLLVGREDDLAAARALLRTTHLLTITGAGGTGKTRLARAIAVEELDGFADGAWFVDLSAVRDGSDVASVVARVIGFGEEGGHDIVRGLDQALAARSLLLVLDNLEQIADVARPIARMHTAAASGAGTRILATSRGPVRLRGERELALGPLALPAPVRAGTRPDAHALLASPAVRLFIDRARAAAPDFELTPDDAAAVGELCRRLDGLPLAIELVAARSRMFRPADLLDRLGRHLDLAGAADLPDRQRTLRSTIDWSWQLLDPPARRLLGRLGLFASGWTLGGAEAVAGSLADRTAGDRAPDGLAVFAALEELRDRGLVRALPSGDHARFGMLETVRAFAREQVEQDPGAEAARRRFVAYHAVVAEGLRPKVQGPDQPAALAELDDELPNIEAALDLAESLDDVPTGLRIATALLPYAQVRTLVAPAVVARLERSLARPAGSAVDQVTAHAFGALAQLAMWVGRLADSERWAEESRIRFVALGDQGGVGDQAATMAFTLIVIDPARASALYDVAEAAYASIGGHPSQNYILQGRLILAARRHDVAEFRRLFAQRAALPAALPRFFALFIEIEIGWLALMEGRPADAATSFATFFEGMIALGSAFGTAYGLELVAHLAQVSGDAERALVLGTAARRQRGLFAAGVPVVQLFDLDDLLAEAAAQVGPATERYARETGEAMTSDEATSLARGVLRRAAGAAGAATPRQGGGPD